MRAGAIKSGGHDCIIIGGGHNGLVCATELARAGLDVLVLEASAQCGGAAVTREFSPGFRVPACAHRLHMLSSDLIRSLKLESFGLKWAARQTPSVALAADGAHLIIGDAVTGHSSATAGRDGTRGQAGASSADEAAFTAYRHRMRRFAAALRPTLESIPPRLGTSEFRDKLALAKLGWSIRKLGRNDMRELLRIGGMNVYDLLEEHFESSTLKGALAFDALLGVNAGPRSPGTVLTLLYRLAAESGAEEFAGAQAEGGMGAVTQALVQAAEAAGVVIRTSSLVTRVIVEDDCAVGVTLASGERVAAKAIVSNADPKRSFLSLLGAEHLDTGFVRRVAHLRTGGVAAKLHLALSQLPVFSGVDPALLGGRLSIAPSMDAIERAYNHSKYGEFSAQPVMEITLPTMADSSLAPGGRHVLSAVVQFAPYALREGWETGREKLLRAAVAILDGYAPGIAENITAAELLTPHDIEREFGITGGHWHHAELAFDQFYMVRPVPGAAQYSTPMKGFYLCGAGAHPGGGVNGLAGRNAAKAHPGGGERRMSAARVLRK